jgi:hypothetical protein
MQPLITSI